MALCPSGPDSPQCAVQPPPLPAPLLCSPPSLHCEVRSALPVPLDPWTDHPLDAAQISVPHQGLVTPLPYFRSVYSVES